MLSEIILELQGNIVYVLRRQKFKNMLGMETLQLQESVLLWTGGRT